MTKQLFLAAAFLPAAMVAQVPAVGAQPGWIPIGHAGSAFQQAGWISLPVARFGTGLVSFDSPRIEGQTGPVLNRPVSANEVRTSVQTLSDGSHVNKSETIQFYRDSMGRMVTKTSTGSVIYDPVAGYTYDLTDRNNSYTKSPISTGATVTIAAAAHYSSVSSTSGNRKKAPSKKGNEAVTEDLPPQSVNGVFARGTRVTVTIPVNTFGNDADLKVINERWVSDDLKLLLKSTNSDPRFGTTTYELTNIVQAEPDPALFKVPANYVEGH